MLSSVLHSKVAIGVNIAIMRAFVHLREVVATHKDLARKLDELERKLGGHDQHIRVAFDAIRQLMIPPPEPQKKQRAAVEADFRRRPPEEPPTGVITKLRPRGPSPGAAHQESM